MAVVDSDQSTGFLTSITPSQATPTRLGNTDITSFSYASATSAVSSGIATQTSTAAPNEQQNGDGASAGLSSSAKKVVICTTTIGGTLILALLLYALWRKRKGASYAEIVRFRPQSDTVMTQSDSYDNRLTALPIYRQERFSIRSSRHSLPAAPKPPKKMPSHGSSLRKEFRADTPEPLMPSRPQTSKSNKTLRMKGPRAFFQDATPPRPRTAINEPEKAPTRSSEDHSHTGHFIHSKASFKNMKATERSSTAPQLRQQSTDTNATEPHILDTLDAPDRWSWTNSQAPPTPRIAAGPRLSLSARSIRSVASWMTAGSKNNRKDDEPKMPSPLRPKPKRQKSRQELLKNQAVKPILAPPPARNRLSKQNGRHGRVGSLSSIFKPMPGSLVPAPLSPRVEEPRPTTPTSIEMRQNFEQRASG